MNFHEFQRKFFHLWYWDQTPEEQAVAWLPSKRPAQIAEEFLQYLWIVSCVNHPRVLEIGVKDGHQRRFYEELLDCDVYVGVDIRDVPGATIVGNSQDEKTIDDIKTMSPIYDIIFIDGVHSREGVRRDHEIYLRLVSHRGYLAMHDIHHDHAEYCDGAARLWPEVQTTTLRTWDIWWPNEYLPKITGGGGSRKQCGIGLVQVM